MSTVLTVLEYLGWWTLASLTAGLLLARIGHALKKTRRSPR